MTLLTHEQLLILMYYYEVESGHNPIQPHFRNSLPNSLRYLGRSGLMKKGNAPYVWNLTVEGKKRVELEKGQDG